jgi:uncharacterized membrane protein YeaQ/YmgE (transglycosylase-associated protein family)
MTGAGFGLMGDIVTGLAGALIGGFLFGQVARTAEEVWGSTLVAFLGACLLIFIVRFVALKRTRL